MRNYNTGCLLQKGIVYANEKYESSITIPGLDELVQEKIMSSSMYKQAPTFVRARAGTNLRTGDTITTNGWDTVYVIKAKYLNKAIILKKTSPTNFEETLEEDGDVYKIQNGEFEDWQVVAGGDGKNVNMQIPIKKGTYVSASGKEYDIANTKLIVQVKLAYIYNGNSQNDSSQEGKYDLKVASPTGTNVVAIVDAYFSNTIPNTHKFIIQGIMSQWLNENLSAFNNVFCSIYLEKLSSKDRFAWSKPTYMSYAYAEKSSFEESIFAVLCMTNNHSAAGLSNQVSSIILNSDDTGALVINSELFIKEVYIPGLRATYEGQNIEFKQNGRIVTAKGFKLEGVKYGLITYHPVVEDFRVEFGNSSIQMTMNIKINISPGIDAYVDVTTFQTLTKMLNDKNEPIISYLNTAPAKITHRIEVAPELVATLAVVEIVIALAGAVAFAAVEGTMYRVIVCLVAGLCVALVGVIVVIVKEVVAKGVIKSLPSINEMVQNISSPVIWPLCNESDLNRFDLQKVEYNSEIILKGNPGFTV